MATFIVENPAEDMVTVLIRVKYGKDASQKKQEAEKEHAALSKIASSKNTGKVLADVFLRNIQPILAEQKEGDKGSLEAKPLINAAYNLAFSLLQTLPDAESQKHISAFVDSLREPHMHSAHPRLTLKLLNTLFNMRATTPKQRHEILVLILTIAEESKLPATLASQLSGIQKWVEAWKLSPAESAQIYVRASRIAAANRMMAASQRFLFQYFEALQNADASLLNDAKPYAAQAAVAAIKSPRILDCDRLLGLKAVLALENDKEYAPVFRLLRIVAQEGVESYRQFQQKHKGVVEKLGLDDNILLSKMRTLTICTLAMQSRVLSFDELQQKLQVKTEEEMEERVIDAVVSGEIDAKIDQENRTVIIQRTTARTFRPESWQELSDQLSRWKQNVGDVLDALSHLRARGLGGDEEEEDHDAGDDDDDESKQQH